MGKDNAQKLSEYVICRLTDCIGLPVHISPYIYIYIHSYVCVCVVCLWVCSDRYIYTPTYCIYIYACIHTDILVSASMQKLANTQVVNDVSSQNNYGTLPRLCLTLPWRCDVTVVSTVSSSSRVAYGGCCKHGRKSYTFQDMPWWSKRTRNQKMKGNKSAVWLQWVLMGVDNSLWKLNLILLAGEYPWQAWTSITGPCPTYISPGLSGCLARNMLRTILLTIGKKPPEHLFPADLLSWVILTDWLFTTWPPQHGFLCCCSNQRKPSSTGTQNYRVTCRPSWGANSENDQGNKWKKCW